ncbi:MAG TPA: FAD-binding oxidoreductase [Clostridia bacterium]|nr:FAD-binding oxidoreductase [Clostridia bacterium]
MADYQILADKLGAKMTMDEFERKFYTRDLAPVPKVMTQILFHTMPDAIVKPTAVEDIQEVLSFAQDQKTPVTPRAAATTAYLNTVPVNQGIVLDLNSLRGILSLESDTKVVEVWCGTPWIEVEEELNREGMAVCSCPSSGLSSTVGGWFSMEGYGIGSVQYGCFHDLVEEAEIVLPGGKVIHSTREGEYPLEWFMGKEGTLGVVTRIKFRIRQKPEVIRHFALGFKSLDDLAKAAMKLEETSAKPYNMHFANRVFFELQSELGFGTHCTDYEMLTVTYQGTEDEVQLGEREITRVARETGAMILDREVADEEWEQRFYALKIKRGGPTLLASEVILPLAKLDAFSQTVKKLGQRTAVYAHFMNDGKINCLVLYYADETKMPEYLFLLAKTKMVYDAALALGGRPYGTGLWNAVYVHRVYGADIRSRWLNRKTQLDPYNIMNPGKFYRPPALLHPAVFSLGAGMANGLSRSLGIGRGR